MALAPDGDLIVSDYLSSTIRRATPGGTIRRLAGSGDIGFSGDDGNALNASLQLPYGLAVDELGNVYFADQSNHRIRRVDAFTGRITGPLFIANGYNGSIDSQFGNPLGDRPAFVGRPSEIFLRSDLNLTSLRGQQILVRFVVGTDGSQGAEGWYIDNVRVEAGLN